MRQTASSLSFPRKSVGKNARQVSMGTAMLRAASSVGVGRRAHSFRSSSDARATSGSAVTVTVTLPRLAFFLQFSRKRETASSLSMRTS